MLAQYDHHHVLVSALRIADIVMQKLLETLPDTFVKEGVLYAVDALLMSETSSRSVLQKSRNIHQSSGQTANGCLCYTFHMGLSLEKEPCKIEKDTVYTLAKHLKATYFGGEIFNSEIGLTETIQKLRTFCALLSNDVKKSSQNDCCADEEHFSHILEQIMGELNGANPMSTFEFIESGVVRSLAQYLSNGKYLKEKADRLLPSNFCVLLKRFETFVKLSLTALHLQCEDTCFSLLVRRLQSALSSLEHFPVIASHAPKSGDVYASIPGCCTKHPCLRVRFVREEWESVLSDHSLGVLTVDSFSSFDDIERFLWPKVGTNRVEDSVDPKGPLFIFFPLSLYAILKKLHHLSLFLPWILMFGMAGKDVTDDLNTVPKSSEQNPVLGRNYKEMKSFQDSDMQVIPIKICLHLAMQKQNGSFDLHCC